MKKIFTILAAVLITATLWAQSPEKMSYQAVIRDASDNLVTDQAVGMQISILQGSTSGTIVYVETHNPTTSANGLVSLEIGTGTVLNGDFSIIDWANGPYFIKTETDPAGGTSYTITGTSQLLSVPYALHAKTAETVSGGITETDPVYTSSQAANITASDITSLSNLSGTNTGDQDISGIATNTQAIKDTASQIRGDLSTVATSGDYNDLGNAPANVSSFTNDVGYLTQDTTLNETEVDAFVANNGYAAQTALEDTASQIRSDIPNVPSGTQTGNMQYWDGTQWVTVAAGSEGQVLTFVGGVPTWTTEVGDKFVINFTTGKIWMDRNLGASQVATSSTDTDAYGDLYQWGRGTDGHESRTSGTTSTLATSDTPGHENFITNTSSPHDWRSPQNNDLWQGVNGTNNPCPSGYRLPTDAEWEAERQSWSSNNAAGAFASPLKLPVAGDRNGSDGSVNGVGTGGYYWSSTVDGTYSWYRYFGSGSANMSSTGRANGFSVRCLKD